MHRSLQRKISILVGMNTTNLNKNLDGIQKRLGELRRFAATAFRWVSIGATIAVGALGYLLKSVIQTGAQFERFEVQLSVLFGSVEKAKEKFAWIKEFAKATPFELPELVDATARLKATGLEAENVLRDLGDLASAAQKPLEQVVMAVSNIASGMLGIGMKQLRLLNINNQMMKQQGIIFDRQGSITNTSSEVIASLQRIVQERFRGMMEEASKTLSGIMSNLADAWTQIKGLIADKINPVIKKELQKIQDWAFHMINSGEMSVWANKIGQKLVDLFNGVRELFPKILNAAKKFWDFIAPPLKWLIENPEMLKTAAILLVFEKLTILTYEWTDALKKTFTWLLVKGSLVLEKLATRTAAVAAAANTAGLATAATGATAAVAGAEGVTAAAVGGAAGAGLLATIIPIAIGVLGAAAVGYAIYKLVDRHNTRVDRKADTLNDTRARTFEIQQKSVDAKRLLAEYQQLYPVVERSRDQQKKYNEVVRDLGKLFPEAVLKTNDFGEAVEINASKIQKGTSALAGLAIAQQRLLQNQQEDLLGDLAEELGKLDTREFDKLEKKVAEWNSPDPFPNMLQNIDPAKAAETSKELERLRGELAKAKAALVEFDKTAPIPEIVASVDTKSNNNRTNTTNNVTNTTSNKTNTVSNVTKNSIISTITPVVDSTQWDAANDKVQKDISGLEAKLSGADTTITPILNTTGWDKNREQTVANIMSLENRIDSINQTQVNPTAWFSQNTIASIEAAETSLTALYEKEKQIQKDLNNLKTPSFSDRQSAALAAMTEGAKPNKNYIEWEINHKELTKQLSVVKAEIAAINHSKNFRLKIETDVEIDQKDQTTQFEDMQKKLNGQLKALSAAFPDITQEAIGGEFRAYMRSQQNATEEMLSWYETRLKEYQERLRAPVNLPEEAPDRSISAKLEENQVRSDEALAQHQEKMAKVQESIDEQTFKNRTAQLSEFDQERRAIEEKFAKFRAALAKDQSIVVDVKDPALIKEQIENSSRISETSRALGIAQTARAEGRIDDTELKQAQDAFQSALAQQEDLFKRMQALSENYKTALSGFNQQEQEAKGVVDEGERQDRLTKAAEETVRIEEMLANQRQDIAERSAALQLATYNQYYQGYMAIVREGEGRSKEIMKAAVDGKISFMKALALAQQSSELTRQQTVLATLEQTSALEQEIMTAQRDARLRGYEIDFITREEWALRANELLGTLREEDFASHEAYLEAKKKLEDIAAGKQVTATKLHWKLLTALNQAGFTTLFRAGQLWAAGELKMRDALKIAALESVAEMVAGTLEAEGKQWAIEAAAAAAKLDFAKAAGLAAAAVAAGVASGWIRARSQANIDRIQEQYDEKEDDTASLESSSGGATRQSGYTTSGVRDIYIQPSITFQGELVIVGDTGLENAATTIGEIAVGAVKQAIETGELEVA